MDARELIQSAGRTVTFHCIAAASRTSTDAEAGQGRGQMARTRVASPVKMVSAETPMGRLGLEHSADEVAEYGGTEARGDANEEVECREQSCAVLGQAEGLVAEGAVGG